ncbi:MAG: cupredoxin family copper-binding protein [Acidimicrobiales bacterium]
MPRQVFRFIGLGVLAVTAAGSLAACAKSPEAYLPGANTVDAEPSAPSGPGGATAVDMINDATTVGAFSPPTLTIKVGAGVTWKNTTSTQHNVTFNDGTVKSSPLVMQQGDTFSGTFATAGTFTYHCTFHPGMDGKVVVNP